MVATGVVMVSLMGGGDGSGKGGEGIWRSGDDSGKSRDGGGDGGVGVGADTRSYEFLVVSSAEESRSACEATSGKRLILHRWGVPSREPEDASTYVDLLGHGKS
ncbi:hypothetical protein Tco_0468833 [Tanacetum coccineum]